MVNLLIDANVFRAIFEEDIGLSAPRPERTASAMPILDQNKRPSKIFVDNAADSQIEAEWFAQCRNNTEWFEAWLAHQYQFGNLWRVDVDASHQQHAKQVLAFGFPQGSRDIWYIRVAYASKDTRPAQPIYLVSEDIDFYDPTKKASSKKQQWIANGRGPVANHLKKNGIQVCCLQAYLEYFP